MSKPQRAADLLKGILRGAQTRASRRELNDALERALGAEMAERCTVTGFRAGKLVVETDSAPLYSELTGFRREQVRRAMNETLVKQQIAQLVFRMGGTGHV